MCEYISMHVCVATFVWTVMLFLIRLIKLVKYYGKQNKHIKVEKIGRRNIQVNVYGFA